MLLRCVCSLNGISGIIVMVAKKYFITVKKNEECGLRVVSTTSIDYCDSSWTFLCLKNLNDLGTSPQKQARIK